LIYGQMTEPPGARARVALTGLAAAEYFRDVEGQDVLFFVDNIFRFTQAGSEVSALLGRMPSASVTNRRWLQILVNFKSESLQPPKGQLQPCSVFTCLLMT